MGILSSFPFERQLDAMDCGPACIKMIAKHYGKFYSLQFLRDKCGLSREGVSFLDIGNTAEEIGMRTVSFNCTLEELVNKVPLPAIVHWDNNHFIVVYDVKGNLDITSRKEINRKCKIYVSDPSRGLISYSTEEFSHKWIKHDVENLVADKYKKGTVMALEPQSIFYEQKEGERANRIRTFSNLMG